MDTTSRSFERVERLVWRLTFKHKKYEPRIEYKKRRPLQQPILHRHKKAVENFSIMVEEGKLENAFKDSDLSDLAIVIVHNYDEKTILEQSLDFLGVEDYTVLKHDGEWEMTYKFIYLLEFIEECKKPYILYCDSRDAIFTDDPAKVMSIFFEKFKCEALFNCTTSTRGIFKSYKWTLPLYWWTKKMSSGRMRFANAGAFVGKTQFIKEISEVMLFYCERMGGCNYCPNSDQDILRAIYPWFWPRMMIDYYNKIFYRN